MNEKNNSITTKKAVLIYITVSLFLVFEMAVQVSPSVMALSLMHDLAIGTFALGVMSSVYFYTYTAMQIPSGLLFDRYKPKFIIACSILVCSLGTLLFGMANSFYLACFARLLMGLGSAFAFVSVLVVASDLFATKYFALIAGVTQMLAALGAMFGQLPIHFLVISLGWHLTMILLAAFGVLLFILIAYTLNYKQASVHRNLDEQSFLKNITTDLLTIIQNKQNWITALYACLLWAPMSGFASLWGVPFLIHHYHLSPSSAALASSIMWLGLAVGSPLLGVFSSVLNNRIIPLWFSAILGVISFAFVVQLHLSFVLLAIALFIAGAACAGQALSFAVVKHNNSAAVKSTAIAFNNMAVVISGALFQPLIGKLIEHYQPLGLSVAYQYGCYLILLAYIVGFAVSFFFVRERAAETV